MKGNAAMPIYPVPAALGERDNVDVVKLLAGLESALADDTLPAGTLRLLRALQSDAYLLLELRCNEPRDLWRPWDALADDLDRTAYGTTAYYALCRRLHHVSHAIPVEAGR